jgi:hypothetical protein
LILTVLGCKKDPKEFGIGGSVVNKKGSTPIAGATIYLDAKKLENGVFNPSFANLTSAVSDANGHYSFDFEEQRISDYRFRVYKDGFFDVEEFVDVDVLQASSSFEKSFQMTQISWIELIVQNTRPQANDDEINYRFVNINVSGQNCCNNQTVIGIGPAYSATTLCKSQSDEWIKISWVVKKNGSQNLYLDSIYATAAQTNTFTISY